MRDEPSYEQLEELSEQMLIDYFGTPRFPIKPIDVEAFARDFMGLEIRYERLTFGPWAQLALTASAGTVVELLPGHPEHNIHIEKDTILLDPYLSHPSKEAQRRFTIGHECGHHAVSVLVDAKGIPLIQKTDIRKMSPYQQFRFEWYANAWSASFLMPRYLVECMRLILDHTEKYIIYEGDRLLYNERQQIAKLAKKLNVSPSAMLYRLKKLNLVEICSEMDYLDDAYQEHIKEGWPYGSFFSHRPSSLRPGQKRARPATAGIIIA